MDKPAARFNRRPPAVSDHHGRLSYDEPRRLRASAAVHDHRETPSAIPLKPASAIAEIRKLDVNIPHYAGAIVTTKDIVEAIASL